MIKVIIVDDHQIFIDGLKSLLTHESGIQVVGEAQNGEEALNLVRKNDVDIVLMDINMPVMDGLKATDRITSLYPHVKVLMLTMHNSKQHISAMLKAGAKGYILKNTGKMELLSAIHALMKGDTYYSQSVTSTIMESLREPVDNDITPEHFSARELEIIRLIAQEYTTQEIASKLSLSQNTIETHRKNIMSKLDVRNVVGLVKFAVKYGLAEVNGE